MASELLKAALVREALKCPTDSAAKLTDSKISVMTGIHRKDVKRLKSNGGTPPLRRVPVTTQVVGAWLSDQGLRGQDGRPRPIARKKRGDTERDFEDLVTSVSKDVRPRVVLEELLERKVVGLTADDRVELFADRLLQNQDDATLASFLGMNIHDHLSAAVSNFLRDRAPLLERNVFHQGLSRAAVERLADLAEKLTMQALLQLNDEAHRLASDPVFRGNQRFNCGVYFYAEESTKKTTATSDE